MAILQPGMPSLKPATLPSSMSPQALPGHGRKRKSTGQESIAYLDITMKMKNIAPYTEFTVILISMTDENYGEEYEYRHKEYITKNCLDLINNKGYKLC